MDTLRQKRQRAGELDAFDPDGVRRSTGRAQGSDNRADEASGGGAGFEDPAPSPENSGDSDGPQGPSNTESDLGGGGFGYTSVVLSDVVDASTQDILRRAQRSASPRTKAVAAKRAQDQVHERLKRLRESKRKIREHLQKLRAH